VEQQLGGAVVSVYEQRSVLNTCPLASSISCQTRQSASLPPQKSSGITSAVYPRIWLVNAFGDTGDRINIHTAYCM